MISFSNRWKQCYLSCGTCNEPGTEAIQNCLNCSTQYPISYLGNCYANGSCPSGLVEQNSTCVKCHKYEYVDRENNICTNCSNITKFFYKNQCVSPQPNGTYVAVKEYGVLEQCYTLCKTCLV